VIEARADEALLTAHKNLLKDDELVIVMGKAQPDRFSGGMQFTITQIWDLDQARCRFGKYLRVQVDASPGSKLPDVARMLAEFPAKREMAEQGETVRGLQVRLQVQVKADANDAPDCPGATAELQLGEGARVYPSDAALAAWRLQAEQGQAAIAYE
jgi:DNA polymerase-3 subunit alpha